MLAFVGVVVAEVGVEVLLQGRLDEWIVGREWYYCLCQSLLPEHVENGTFRQILDEKISAVPCIQATHILNRNQEWQ